MIGAAGPRTTRTSARVIGRTTVPTRTASVARAVEVPPTTRRTTAWPPPAVDPQPPAVVTAATLVAVALQEVV